MLIQSQKTQGFCVADFVTLSGERRFRSEIFPLFIWIKEPCVRKIKGLERSKLLGISQTKLKDLRYYQVIIPFWSPHDRRSVIILFLFVFVDCLYGIRIVHVINLANEYCG